MQWKSIDEEAEGLATFIARKVQDGVRPGMCLVLANSREVGSRIKQAVQARGIDIRSFFREEPVEKPIAQEKLTLLTLLATPEDRPALRSWIGLGTADGLVGVVPRQDQAPVDAS